MKPDRLFPFASLVCAVLGSQAAWSMSNDSDPTNWRVNQGQTFNGVSFDGVAQIFFDGIGDDGAIDSFCSGTLLSGGTHIVTVARCAENFATTRIEFGVYGGIATETRGASQAWVHPLYDGRSGHGTDLAIIQLDSPVSISGFNLDTSSAVGKTALLMGHGVSRVGNSSESEVTDYGYAHWGYNVLDVTTNNFLNAAANMGLQGLGSWSNEHGEEYVSDYDGEGDPDRFNTLGRITGLTSDEGFVIESLSSVGDSGGGAFVWSGSEWLLTGVTSWFWQFCNGRLESPQSCDFSTSNASSWGDLMGSTAVYRQVDWIHSIVNPATAVPEPGSFALMLLGLAGFGFARRGQRSSC